MTIESSKHYLERMERNRKKDEPYNKRAYADARELAALVNVAEYGSMPYSKWALKAVQNI